MDDKVIILAASLGGPPLVNEILSSLKPSFSTPILVLQQMESDFSEPLTAAWGKTSSLRMIRLTDDEIIRGGSAYVIPYCTSIAFEASGDDVSLKPQTLKPGSNVCGQWDQIFEECIRQFEDNVVLILLTDCGMHRNSLDVMLGRLQKAGSTVINCIEKYNLNSQEQDDTCKSNGWLEMEIDQIIVFLQKISEGRLVSTGSGSGR